MASPQLRRAVYQAADRVSIPPTSVTPQDDYLMPTRTYFTGLVTSDQPGTYPPPPWAGAGWRAELQPERPGRGTTIAHYRIGDREITVNGMEVIVHASSRITAQRAVDSIWAALHLLQGNPPFVDAPVAVPTDEQDAEGLADEELPSFKAYRLNTPNISLAAYAGAKASRRRDLTYALALYHLSQSIHSNYWAQLDPHQHRNISLSPFPGDHVRFAYAIVTAYAVLEQLGVEVRATQASPSRIGGAWNPVVKADLEKRLRGIGVDLSDSALLNLRGTVTRLEKTRPKKDVLRRASWSDGRVRDVEVEVVDAIAHLSWIRSKVAAHRMQRDLVPSLSVYDVGNAHYLARRVLSAALGLWRFYEREIEAAKNDEAELPRIVRLDS
jgi:hypothetical protein